MNGKFLLNKVAVVTGASRGLGRAIAISLSEQGANIALIGRDEKMLTETSNFVEKNGVKSKVFKIDVTKENEIESLKEDVKKTFGNCHILINNAGTAIRSDIENFSLEDWNKVMNTNLTGAFLMSRAFIPQMKENSWGRIINITSIMSHIGSQGRSAYCASKSALLAITKCMALELVEFGINVVAISPGFYKTDLTEPLRQDEKFHEKLMSMTPAKRWGDPSEIGKIATFVCSDAASFMTGNDILSDGGWVSQ